MQKCWMVVATSHAAYDVVNLGKLEFDDRLSNHVECS